MHYYIDGTIDSITIGTGAASIEFSFLPSSDFLKTVADGINVKKKALFIKSETPDMAYLRDVTKNESERDIIKFSIEAETDSSLNCLLLEAKNNRNTVRVFIGRPPSDKASEEPANPSNEKLSVSSLQIL